MTSEAPIAASAPPQLVIVPPLAVRLAGTLGRTPPAGVGTTANPESVSTLRRGGRLPRHPRPDDAHRNRLAALDRDGAGRTTGLQRLPQPSARRAAPRPDGAQPRSHRQHDLDPVPEAGTAARRTLVDPQPMPPGVLVIVPAPRPCILITITPAAEVIAIAPAENVTTKTAATATSARCRRPHAGSRSRP